MAARSFLTRNCCEKVRGELWRKTSLWERLQAHHSESVAIVWQAIDSVERHKLLKKCEQHVRFCVKMYKYQLQHCRYFSHEHPHTTSSWEMQEVWKLMSEAGVYYVEIDQCETVTVLP